MMFNDQMDEYQGVQWTSQIHNLFDQKIYLKKAEVFDHRGRVKRNAYTIDKKTKKHNILYLRPIERDLEDYYDWLEKYESDHPNQSIFTSKWLFPSMRNSNKHN